jgi:hypothetical protein
MNSEWEFEHVDGRIRPRMHINQSMRDARDEPSWSAIYDWFGHMLSLVYAKVAPALREEMDRKEREA